MTDNIDFSDGPPTLTVQTQDLPDSTVRDTPSKELESVPMDTDQVKTEPPLENSDSRESVAPIVIKTSPNGAPVVISNSGKGGRGKLSADLSGGKSAGANAPAKRQQKEKPPAPITVLVRALTHPTTGMYPGGISPKQLLDYLNSVNPADMQTTKNQLQVQLCRQANRGHLVRMQTGCYTTPDLVSQIQASGKMPPKPEKASKARKSPPGGGTPSGKAPKKSTINRKNRAPKPFSVSGAEKFLSKIGFKSLTENHNDTGDSEDHKPKRKRTKKQMGPEFVTEEASKKAAFCDFCLQSAPKTENNKQEAMLYCRDCAAKAHPSCMGYSEELAVRCRRSPWQCIDCKACVVCSTSENADSLLFCDSCDKGYHMACHSPIIHDKPPGKWACSTCTLYGVLTGESRSTTQSPTSEEVKKLTTKGKPKLMNLGNKKPATSWLRIQPGGIVPVCRCDANAVLPDLSWDTAFREAAHCAKTWSALQVHEFVKELGFPDEAASFAEQEIDGQALLLLKRSDVLSRLSLKLGPALKLYRRILAIQSAYERLANSSSPVVQN